MRRNERLNIIRAKPGELQSANEAKMLDDVEEAPLPLRNNEAENQRCQAKRAEVERIKAKPEELRSAEEAKILQEIEEDRVREREAQNQLNHAQGKEIERIKAKPEELQSAEEAKMLDASLSLTMRNGQMKT